MLKSQIKAMLRNKSNRKYIIILFIMFIFLNIGINLSYMIDSYYDMKLRELADDETINDLKIINISPGAIIDESGISHTLTLTNEQQEYIKKVKYVIDFKVETTEFLGTTFNTYKTYVDDWRHVSYVKNVLDKQGIDTGFYQASFNIQIFMVNYANIQVFVNVIKYAIIVITIIIILTIYKNIIKNQVDDLKLLTVLGYKPRQIRKIKLVNLLIITAISWLIGIVLFSILIFIFGVLEINLLKDVIINILVYAIVLVVAILIKKKKNN